MHRTHTSSRRRTATESYELPARGSSGWALRRGSTIGSRAAARWLGRQPPGATSTQLANIVVDGTLVNREQAPPWHPRKPGSATSRPDYTTPGVDFSTGGVTEIGQRLATWERTVARTRRIHTGDPSWSPRSLGARRDRSHQLSESCVCAPTLDSSCHRYLAGYEKAGIPIQNAHFSNTITPRIKKSIF